MHFERTFIPDEVNGTPEKACEDLTNRINDLSVKIEGLNEQVKAKVQKKQNAIVTSYERIKIAYENFDVRKMATHTNNDGEIFYIICGWMTEKDCDRFIGEIKDDDNVVCIVEDRSGRKDKTPPTKLKNPKIFKPFEMYIKMYGLPAYNELDPGSNIRCTYLFIYIRCNVW